MSNKPLYSHDKNVKVGKSMTKQDSVETPASIWRKFQAGQPLPEAPPPVYADLTRINFREAREQAAAFNSEFQELPAELRLGFDNDPAAYLEWLEENKAEIAADGLPATLRALYDDPKEAPRNVREKPSEGPSEPENAQTGATDPESGTE